MSRCKKNIFTDKKIVSQAIKDSFRKLDPRTQVKNPVMFMVFVSAIMGEPYGQGMGQQDRPGASVQAGFPGR